MLERRAADKEASLGMWITGTWDACTAPALRGTNLSTTGLWKSSKDWEERMSWRSEGPHSFLSKSSSLPANKHPHYSHCHPSMELKVGVKPRITSQHGLPSHQGDEGSKQPVQTDAPQCLPPSLPPAYLHLAHYSNRQVNGDLISNMSFFTVILNDLE